MNTNKEVMRAFATGKELIGTNVKSKMIEGKLCFVSYQTIVGYWIDNNTVSFTTTKYSKTTSKQITQCKYECYIPSVKIEEY